MLILIGGDVSEMPALVVRCSDLQGFWDMVEKQVENVTVRFEYLEKVKSNNYVKTPELDEFLFNKLSSDNKPKETTGEVKKPTKFIRPTYLKKVRLTNNKFLFKISLSSKFAIYRRQQQLRLMIISRMNPPRLQQSLNQNQLLADLQSSVRLNSNKRTLLPRRVPIRLRLRLCYHQCQRLQDLVSAHQQL